MNFHFILLQKFRQITKNVFVLRIFQNFVSRWSRCWHKYPFYDEKNTQKFQRQWILKISISALFKPSLVSFFSWKICMKKLTSESCHFRGRLKWSIFCENGTFPLNLSFCLFQRRPVTIFWLGAGQNLRRENSMPANLYFFFNGISKLKHFGDVDPSAVLIINCPLFHNLFFIFFFFSAFLLRNVSYGNAHVYTSHKKCN